MNGISWQIHQIPHRVLADALPQLRPFDAHQELRRAFAAWTAGARQNFDSWQDAWNAWTHATPGHPGVVELQTLCPDCHGRLFTTRHGVPGMCTSCMGRRTRHVRTIALWQHPPENAVP